jgi:2-keto-4-pentenoate hydratase/2-oxohepta-3-ene-1,7-dioic acid hydratase in catechol pathway
MKIARFDDDRLGLVVGDEIADVTTVLADLPSVRWPVPPGDLLIRYLAELAPTMREAAKDAERVNISDVHLRSPIANPSKIIAAPVNYLKHQAEARADAGINYGSDVKTIDHYGLFIKASSALAGPADGVVAWLDDRRIDHEVELCVVIGKGGRNISRDDAFAHVAGYTIGLDMSVRGTEDRSYRKSFDTFAVIGPWLVTADEFGDPSAVDFELRVNGEVRQKANTRDLIFDIPKLIVYASSAFTLDPGDIIMTGTPEGVGPVKPGDAMACKIDGIGAMRVAVRGA